MKVLFKQIRILTLAMFIVLPTVEHGFGADAKSARPIEGSMAEYTTNLEGVRLDLSAVIQALFYRVAGYGEAASGPVRFSPETGSLADRSGYINKSFALRKVSIREDAAFGDNPLHRRISAVLMVMDALERKAFFLVSADYLIGDSVILIRQAVAEPYYPTISDVRFFVIPKDRISTLHSLDTLSFEKSYGLIVENALSIESLAELKKWSSKTYILAAVDMMRAPAQSKLQIRISKNEARGRVRTSSSQNLNYGGWHMALVEGKFAFNNLPEYSLFAVMTDLPGSAEPEIIGIISSVFSKSGKRK